MTVRIGAAQGFTGDDIRGTREIVEAGVDYICCEALAEITLTGMHRERRLDERAGFARDVGAVAELALPVLQESSARLVTNAGGLNPIGARQAVAEVARRQGVEGLRVAMVFGSDLTGHLEDLRSSGVDLRHADSGQPLESIGDVEFAAVYLGAFPIAAALDQGADIVITGRVADTSIFMGPAIFELGVAPDDWTRLGRLAVMGHLLECSGQVSGGNFSGAWQEVAGLDAVGFPIAEVEGDGQMVLTKPAESGGLVSVDTVKEQLLYEVADPTRYLTPDVVADMTSVRLAPGGTNRVAVNEAFGTPATDTYKVIMSRPAGWTAAIGITYTYPDAIAKARSAHEIMDKRLARQGFSPLETWVEYIGAGGTFGEVDETLDPPEVILRYAVRCQSAGEAAAIFQERLMGLATGGPPGTASSGVGSSPPTQVSQIWPALVPKELVDPLVRVVVEDL